MGRDPRRVGGDESGVDVLRTTLNNESFGFRFGSLLRRDPMRCHWLRNLARMTRFKCHGGCYCVCVSSKLAVEINAGWGGS
jgi:hypothetical protein